MSAAGKAHTFTEEDLKSIAKAYPKQEKAPLVLGHPKTDDPAYGWIDSVSLEGNTLYADVSVAPELKEMVAEGRYKHKSVALRPDNSIRHLGILGAAPPGVKGLGELSFGEEDNTFNEFSLKEDKGEEGSTMANTQELQELQLQLKTLQEEAAKLKEQLEAASKEKEETEKEFAEFKAQVKTKDRVNRMNALIEKGKVLPGEKDKLLAYAEHLESSSGELEFSEGSKTVKQSLAESFWTDLENRSDKGLLREFSEPSREEPGFTGDLSKKM